MTLAEILAGTILIALTGYALLGGADFGGGVWDLLASGRRKDRQRQLIANAIAPVWEANHVWLILAIVLLFTCFPPVFARLAIALHVPFTLVLIGIVLRGSSFMFQSYGGGGRRVFALASLLTPVLLGVSIGAIASGATQVTAETSFVAGYVRPWLTPFALVVGVFALVCFAFLAAVYLTLEAREEDLQEDFRRRAIVAGAAVVVVAALGLVLSPQAPVVQRGLLATRWAVLLHLVNSIAVVTVFVSLWARRYRIARVAAAAEVSLLLWGWGFSQYPFLLPPDLTIASAAAPRVTLELALMALIIGAIVLFPSLFYLFKVFKSRPM
jgi:cytochrome d ubiquinol oxidase subunit II